MRPTFQLRPLLAAAVAAPLLLAGCGSDRTAGADTAATPTTASAAASPGRLRAGEKRLTTAQASTFSRLLVADHDAKGATFATTIPFSAAVSYELRGDIDWVNYEARAVLHATGAATADQTMYWSKGQLLQPVPGLEAAMKAKGRSGVRFVSRRLDPKAAPIDRVIVLLNSMSNTRPENPILLRQRPDVAYGGHTTIDGIEVETYRYGSTIYHVDAAGSLVRLEATFQGFAAPVVADFTAKGTRTTQLPDAAIVVAASEIGDILPGLLANASQTK